MRSMKQRDLPNHRHHRVPAFKAPALILACGIALGAAGLRAQSPLIEEPFAYPAGNLDGIAVGSPTGLSGTWAATTVNPSVTVEAGSLFYGSLAVSGSRIEVSQMSRRATTGVGTSLNPNLADGGTLWFSFLYRNTRPSSIGDDLSGLALASTAFNPGTTLPLTGSGRGIGVSIDRNQRVTPSYWSSGTRTMFPTFVNIPFNTTSLIVGKIEWGATASDPETLTIYLPGTDLALPASGSVFSVPAMDQSTLNLVTIGTRGRSGQTAMFDEVRFGPTYGDVVFTIPGAPTLPPAGFSDNKNGGPVVESATVVYKVLFSEAMNPATIDPGDFENAGTAPISINSVSASGNLAVVTVTLAPPAAGGTLQLRVKAGAELADASDTPLDTALPITDDTIIDVTADNTPPTVLSIDSPPAASPIHGLPTIPYTVTFDKFLMDDATLSAADFTNAGTASITVGTPTRISTGTAPASYRVEVTPTTPGTLQLRLDGTVGDVIGNNVVTPVEDDTVHTFASSVPARKIITIDESVTSNLTGATHNLPFDASGSDKLVVIVTGENGTPGQIGDCTGVTYDGVALTKAVEREAVPGPFPSPDTGSSDSTYNDIWYLDNPGSVHVSGAISASVSTRAVITAIRLSGTAPGSGTTAVSGPASKSVSFLTTASGSMVIASHGMGGDAATANTGAVDTIPPLIENSAVTQTTTGEFNGHVTGSMLVATPGVVTPTFVGGNLAGTHTIAAEFLAAIIDPGDYQAWAGNFPDADLTNPNDDHDGDGLSNDQERIFGLNPTSGASVNPISIPFDAVAGTFGFTRRDPNLTGLIYKVWTSTNLANDWVVDGGAAFTLGPVVNQVQTVEVKLSEDLLDEPRLFFKVSAE